MEIHDIYIKWLLEVSISDQNVILLYRWDKKISKNKSLSHQYSMK